MLFMTHRHNVETLSFACPLLYTSYTAQILPKIRFLFFQNNHQHLISSFYLLLHLYSGLTVLTVLLSIIIITKHYYITILLFCYRVKKDGNRFI
jgi:hypothetical protein